MPPAQSQQATWWNAVQPCAHFASTCVPSDYKPCSLAAHKVLCCESARSNRGACRCQVAGVLEDYIFQHPREPTAVLVGLGFCSLYNHSGAAANLAKRFVGDELVMTAARDLAEGEELTLDYGEAWWAQGSAALLLQKYRYWLS